MGKASMFIIYGLIAVAIAVVSFIDGWFYFSTSPQSTKKYVAGGPVVSTSQIVLGKVISVNGNKMTIEGRGKKVTIQAASTVEIVGNGTTIQPVPAPPLENELLSASPSSQPGVAIIAPPPTVPTQFHDFSIIPVGMRIKAILDLKENGTFQAISVLTNPPDPDPVQ